MPEAHRITDEEATIRQVAREFSLTPRTLRFYEEKGLVRPRRVGQDRLYSRRDRVRLRYIQMGKSVGFSLDEIRELLELYEQGKQPPGQLDTTLAKVRLRLDRLQAQRVDLDTAIAELTHAGNMIANMIAARQASSRLRTG